MRLPIILIFIAFSSIFQMNSQSQIELHTISPVKIVASMSMVELELVSKKKDILNTKINSKIKGEVDLFFVAEKSKIC